MKLTPLTAVSLLLASLASGVAADTLKKVSDGGRITLGYRESSVPFSYIAGPASRWAFRWISPIRW